MSASESMSDTTVVPLEQLPAAEDQARADFHALLAHLLLRPPDAALLQALARSDSLPAARAEQPLAQAWENLRTAARDADARAVQDEFADLFTSIGNPVVNPYASLYLSGFLMEKPLAILRGDLAVLGLARTTGAGETEDHLGALCEAMRVLIVGAPGLAPRGLDVQRNFFVHHIAPWYARCLKDVREARGAHFYRRVADFGMAFLALESEAFEMVDAMHVS